jgi:hypothetical protein
VLYTQSEALQKLLGQDWGFPTLVYPIANGIGGYTGIPDDVAERVGIVTVDDSQTSNGSKGSAMMSRPFAENSLTDQRSVFAKEDVPMRALPYADAPQVDVLSSGTSRKAFSEIKTDSGHWIAIRFLT